MSDDAAILAEMLRPERRAKFLSRLTVAGDCHLWTGASGGSGYGVLRIGRDGVSHTCSPHRVAWMLANGRPIPAGMEIDHLCRVRLCCNPAHLEPVTPSENETRRRGWRNADRAPIARRSNGGINERRRAGRVGFQLTWRDYLTDGSVIQRGRMYRTRAEAEAARVALQVGCHVNAEPRPTRPDPGRFTLKQA